MLHTTQMILAMLLAGFLSSMGVFASSLEDIRITLNDLYMMGLMTSWMFFFMGVFQKKFSGWSVLGVLFFFVLIRKQMGITPHQYVQGMIPHHSMAVFLSRRVLERDVPSQVRQLAQGIIWSQEKEIDEMKNLRIK